jgi:anti-anti-sigma factor
MPDEAKAPFTVDVINDIAVVRFAGWKVPLEVGQPLYDVLEDQKHSRILLDLGKVTYMSSNVIAILVTLKKRVDAAGGKLKLCRMNPDLVDLLRHTGVDRLFSIYPDAVDALSAFRLASSH